ncbi:MAG: hypothetical protein ABI855_17100 [Bacteroidota bacterium]
MCLPVGDFAALKDLPEMYRHCKATEDKDMTPLDFITDHLINIDGIFDKHDNGDEQKPHSPSPTQHNSHSIFFCLTNFAFTITDFQPVEVKPLIASGSFFYSDYISKILRPPIFA